MSLFNAAEVKVFLLNGLSERQRNRRRPPFFKYHVNRLFPPATRQQQTCIYTHCHAKPFPIHTHAGSLAGEMMVYDVIQ